MMSFKWTQKQSRRNEGGRDGRGGWVTLRGRKTERCDLFRHPLDFITATLSVREPRSGHMSMLGRYGKTYGEPMWHMEIQQTDWQPTHTQLSLWGTARHDHTGQHKQKNNTMAYSMHINTQTHNLWRYLNRWHWEALCDITGWSRWSQWHINKLYPIVHQIFHSLICHPGDTHNCTSVHLHSHKHTL